MRISGGAARGVVLSVPKGDAVRPATDGMRQAVFSSLAACIPDAHFLDLFAGSGSYGLEALSRGAASGVFVEKNGRTVDCLKRNLELVSRSLGREIRDTRILQGDALEWPVAAVDFVPDLIFVDPPYDLIPEVGPKLFGRLSRFRGGEVSPIVVFEMPGEMSLTPDGWSCVKRLGGGVRQPSVAFFKATRAPT